MKRGRIVPEDRNSEIRDRHERAVHKEIWSAWHKQVRMTLLLAPDEAEREIEMTPAMHAWFKGYIDRLLLSLHRELESVMNDMPAQTPGIIGYDQDEQPERDPAPLDEDDEPL